MSFRRALVLAGAAAAFDSHFALAQTYHDNGGTIVQGVVLIDPAAPAGGGTGPLGTVSNPLNITGGSGSGGVVTNNGTFAVQLTGTTNNIQNITGTIVLPTGASTSTNQATELASLSTIATNTANPIPTQAVTVPIGGVSNDPCAYGLKSFADFESTSSGGSIITLSSGKKAYLCAIRVHTSAAANISLIEGTGSSVCTGGTTAGVYLNTGVTAANGAAYPANGGDAFGSGSGTLAANATVSQNICVLFNTTNSPQVNVHVSYVQQ